MARRPPYAPLQRFEHLPPDERLYLETKLLRARHAATLLGMSERDIMAFIYQGRMRTLYLQFKHTKHHLIPAAEVMRFMDTHFPAYASPLPILPSGPLWDGLSMRQRVAAYLAVLEPEEAAWRLAAPNTEAVWGLVRDGLLRGRRSYRQCRFLIVAADLTDFIGRQTSVFTEALRAG